VKCMPHLTQDNFYEDLEETLASTLDYIKDSIPDDTDKSGHLHRTAESFRTRNTTTPPIEDAALGSAVNDFLAQKGLPTR
jgi:hypothetical protein